MIFLLTSRSCLSCVWFSFFLRHWHKPFFLLVACRSRSGSSEPSFFYNLNELSLGIKLVNHLNLVMVPENRKFEGFFDYFWPHLGLLIFVINSHTCLELVDRFCILLICYIWKSVSCLLEYHFMQVTCL